MHSLAMLIAQWHLPPIALLEAAFAFLRVIHRRAARPPTHQVLPLPAPVEEWNHYHQVQSHKWNQNVSHNVARQTCSRQPDLLDLTTC